MATQLLSLQQLSLTNRKRSSSSAFTTPSSPEQPREMSGRTIKRTRARPNEELIHQYTIQKLFAAARALPVAPPKQMEIPLARTQTHEQPQQRGLFSMLHRQAKIEVATVSHGLSCEDCDRVLPGHLEDDEVRCVGCHRAVCDTGCSASNGMGRVCLECARCR